MQPHSARVGNKLLSKLVMINVTSNLSLCSRMFHLQWQWQFIDSDDVVLDYCYVQCLVEINVINYML